MAREYTKIYIQMWLDEKVRALSVDGIFAFILILTHPSMTGFGAMRQTKEGLEAEYKKWSKALPKGLTKGFQDTFEGGFIEYDAEAPLIAVPNFLKWNPPANPNVVKSIIKHEKLLPECDLKYIVLNRLKACCKALGKPFETALGTEFDRKGEGRRENIIKDSTNVESSSEVRSAPSEATPESSGCGIVFQCNGKQKTYEPTEAKIAEWQETYPNLDVLDQVRRARQWCIDNPTKRGTAKGRPAFIVRWLNRATDSPRQPQTRQEGTRQKSASEQLREHKARKAEENDC